MLDTSDHATLSPRPATGLLAAAALQDDLMSVSHDLERLQTLLADACDALMQRFHGAHAGLMALGGDSEDSPQMADLKLQLGGAVTALQFQDMASQLITHTTRRLRHCADRIARDALGEDEAGESVVAEAPQRPNPVTQDEMDAGSIELF